MEIERNEEQLEIYILPDKAANYEKFRAEDNDEDRREIAIDECIYIYE